MAPVWLAAGHAERLQAPVVVSGRVTRAYPLEVHEAQVDELLESLAGLGELEARRMFGAVGLYADAVFFGLVDEGLVYFKVDEESVADYRAAGSAPFRPFPDRPTVSLGYYEVPLGVLEDRATLLAWGRRALAAAARRDARKKRAPGRGRRPPAGARESSVPVARLTNIGPRSAAWLRAAGIADARELERLGAVGAYLAVLRTGVAPTLNLLYALEGARLGLRHDRLSEAVKANLRARLATAQPHATRSTRGPTSGGR